MNMEAPKLKKRAKPFAANNASKKMMEEQGWTCCVVEQVVPHCFIKRDCFGFGDLLCVSASKGIMLVQATGGLSTNNLHPRITKLKAEPRHAIWLAAGGRIQVHSWQGKGNKRKLNCLEITKQ